MQKVEIKGTSLKPTRIGLGTWAIGGWMWGGSDDEESIRTILAALERGVTLIDTAPVYGFGRAEELVGRALERYGRRDRVVVATKVGLEWTPGGAVRRNATPARIFREVEDSLRRLRTDHIDIYQVHWPDPNTPIHETARALAKLYDQGRIRAIGVSNFSVAQLQAFSQAAPLHVLQPPYNLFEREIEYDVLPWCHRHEVATLCYGALCRGLLSGRVTADRRYEGDDLRRVDPKFRSPRLEQYLEAVEALDRFAHERYGRTVLALALRWLLDQPDMSVALWGARSPEQLEPLVEIEGWSLDAAALREIDDIIEQSVADPVGPEFMAPPAA